MKIYNKIKSKFSPQFKSSVIGIYQCCKVFSYALSDAIHYARYSAVRTPFANESVMSYRIALIYHGIEKGLAMPVIRKNFGEAKVVYLMTFLSIYEKRGYNLKTSVYLSAISALKAYGDYHSDECGRPLVKKVTEFVSRRGIDISNKGAKGGVIAATQTKNLDFKQFDEFFRSRYSLRSYSSRSVTKSLLFDVISTAQKTPSVCNRQSFHAYYTSDPSMAAKILEYQNGNRGFGHQVPALIIITADSRAFFASGERNQCYVDGGLFSMSVLLGLHAAGLGACALNWCVSPSQEKSLKALLRIPVEMRVIMMISCGYPKEDAMVPCSSRRDIGLVASEIKV
jgi:nitroreductase